MSTHIRTRLSTFMRTPTIVRPCPELVPLSPQLAYHQVFARNAKEVQALEVGGLRTSRLTHFHLANHEQIALC
ncbi:hypothetical protein [Streptomyces virginiae]|uniref:hypothetical protein n=1 Tax=Streptomyces virginiae TaxID=1961 RepID=UPI0036F6CAE7